MDVALFLAHPVQIVRFTKITRFPTVFFLFLLFFVDPASEGGVEWEDEFEAAEAATTSANLWWPRFPPAPAPRPDLCLYLSQRFLLEDEEERSCFGGEKCVVTCPFQVWSLDFCSL